MRSQITNTTTIGYSISNNKTWTNSKLNCVLLKYIVDKIINILIQVNDMQDKLS